MMSDLDIRDVVATVNGTLVFAKANQGWTFQTQQYGVVMHHRQRTPDGPILIPWHSVHRVGYTSVYTRSDEGNNA